MSLYIRDPDVAALAAKLQDLTGSRTKTEAVRLALQQVIERANAKRSFAQRNAHVLEMADALGSTNPEFELQSVLRSDVGRRLMVLDASGIIAILARELRRPTLRGRDRRRQDAAQRLAPHHNRGGDRPCAGQIARRSTLDTRRDRRRAFRRDGVPRSQQCQGNASRRRKRGKSTGAGCFGVGLVRQIDSRVRYRIPEFGGFLTRWEHVAAAGYRRA